MTRFGRGRSLRTASLLVVVSAIGLTGIDGAPAGAATPLAGSLSLVIPVSGEADSPSVVANGLSCVAVGECTAVGGFVPTGAVEATLVATSSGGAWTGITGLTPPETAAGGGDASGQLSSVACFTVGNCAAVGTFVDIDGDAQVMETTESGGTWSGETEIALPQEEAEIARPERAEITAGAPDVSVSSLSCVSSSPVVCFAVGSFDEGSGIEQPLLVEDQSGEWSTEQLNAPDNESESRQFAELGAIWCASATSCIAVGDYASDDTAGDDMGFETTLSGDGWTAQELTPPSMPPASDAQNVSFYGGSCVAVSSCSFGGSFVDSNDTTQALVESSSNGTWAAQAVSLPPGTVANPKAQVNSLSCPTAGNCLFVGSYETSGGEEGFLAESSAGTLQQAVVLGQPNGSTGTSSATAVTCLSSLICAAAGWSDGDDDLTAGFFAPTLAISTTSIAGATLGASYSATLAATGGTGNDAWSVTSGSLPSGLSLDPSTGVISGIPTAGASGSFSVQVIDTGPPLQTATVSLSIPVPTPATTPVVAAPTATTTTTTLPPSPVVVVPALLPSSTPKPIVTTAVKVATIKKGVIALTVSCSGATCVGMAEIVLKVVVKVKRGKKTVAKTETETLASAHFSLKKKTAKPFSLVLTPLGAATFAHASTKPVTETLELIVGGKTKSFSVTVK